MKARTLLAAALTAVFGWGAAAGQDHHAQTTLAGETADTVEVKNVRELFSKGRIHGHVRNYFMATRNHGALPDNYANAIGAEIGYKTAPFHGFRLGIAGLFTYNAFSSNLDEKDDLTGKYPKLETELFDVEDPENKADLDRLDELYLEYKSDKLRSRFGRFSFTSPLINPQDTRMKPYTVQGISVEIPVQQQALLSLAWFSHFSPRSTVEWFKASESVGIYSTGVDETGEPADYHHHLSTKGVAVAGIQVTPAQRLHTEVWNYWIDNISNTSYSRTVVELAPHVKVGVEGLYQFRVGNGGNPDPDFAYFPDQRQWLVGSRVAYEPTDWHFSLNQLHIGSGGRFLFPREWGREQFFATLSRGRMEGTGKADIVAARVKRKWSGSFSSELALAKAWLPAQQHYEHNKYGAVSYWSWLADLHYAPANPVLRGLSFRLLYVAKVSPDSALPLPDMYYKTNFHNLNLVAQISF